MAIQDMATFLKGSVRHRKTRQKEARDEACNATVVWICHWFGHGFRDLLQHETHNYSCLYDRMCSKYEFRSLDVLGKYVDLRH